MEQPGETTSRHRQIFRWLVPLSLAAVALLLVAQTEILASYAAAPLPLEPTLAYSAPLVRAPNGEVDAPIPVSRRLASGESIDLLLGEFGLTSGERREIVRLLGAHAEVRRLRPGIQVTAYYDRDEAPRGIEFVLRREGRLRVESSADGWSGEWSPFEESTTVRRAVGTVTSSLTASMAEADAPTAVAYRVAEVLRWDVDFNRDLRSGDRFEVLYQEVSLQGRFDHVGEIAAVRFWNRGRLVEAYRYGDDAYFDGEGRPLEKMFLRSPLPFTRITSHFSHRRYHPVLKRYRPHYGVDYGAPTGTPIYVTADGTVTHAAYGRGEGNMVKVRHANGYLTAYLHLSRFAGGIRPGVRVEQGQTIGYVGATGLATGPHLDYRIRHDGRWIDPLSLDPMPAEPIPADQMRAFRTRRDELRQGLDGATAPTEGSLRVAATSPADGVPATASFQ